MGSLRIRPAVHTDLPRLTEIYNHYVVNTAITFDLEPFTIERRAEWFAEHAAAGRHRLLVAEQDGRVLGYASSSRFRDRAAYDTTAETSIYCAPEATAQGVGTALYRDLFASIEHEDINRLAAGITLPNEASIALHKRFRFVQVGVFTQVGRKFGRYWDVAWYDRPLQL